MTLTRIARPKALISLVPMIDVMLILLVFFMVTSTYLNLDMIPSVEPSQDRAPAEASAATGRTLLIRLGSDGRPVLHGKVLAPGELAATLEAAARGEPQARVLILPSGAADAQALISVLDAAALAGVQDLRILRLEAEQ
jgi:biopolymer transport protein ExbD